MLELDVGGKTMTSLYDLDESEGLLGINRHAGIYEVSGNANIVVDADTMITPNKESRGDVPMVYSIERHFTEPLLEAPRIRFEANLVYKGPRETRRAMASCLLDTGARLSFVSVELAQRIGARLGPKDSHWKGLGSGDTSIECRWFNKIHWPTEAKGKSTYPLEFEVMDKSGFVQQFPLHAFRVTTALKKNQVLIGQDFLKGQSTQIVQDSTYIGPTFILNGAEIHTVYESERDMTVGAAYVEQHLDEYEEMVRLETRPQREEGDTADTPDLDDREGLSEESKVQLQLLIGKFNRIMVRDDMEAQHIKPQHRPGFDMRIEVDQDAPACCDKPIWPETEEKRQELHKVIAELLEGGLIERTTPSRWLAKCFLVKKKSLPNRPSRWRLVVDYRKLNSYTKSMPHRFPTIKEIFAKITPDLEWFSQLDLHRGFWNLALEESSRQYTTFAVTGLGSFRWAVCVMGLKNSPAAFSKLVESVLLPVQLQCDGRAGQFVESYIDDLLIATRTQDDHLQLLDKVLNALSGANLMINPDKCTWLSKSVEFLGSRIGGGRIAPDESKLKIIQEYPRPRTRKQLDSFLGLCSWLRDFVPHFSRVAALLYNIPRGPFRKSTWNESHTEAFERMKELMLGAQELCIPDPSLPFVLDTDASLVGLGACLKQSLDGSGTLFAVGYWARKLSSQEQNLSTYERELLAILGHWARAGIPMAAGRVSG